MIRVGVLASLTVLSVLAAGGTAAALNVRVLDPGSPVPVGRAEVFVPSADPQVSRADISADAPSAIDVSTPEAETPSLTEVPTPSESAEPTIIAPSTAGSEVTPRSSSTADPTTEPSAPQQHSGAADD